MNFPHMIKKVALVVAMAAAVPAFASTNLVSNGSFESNSLASGTWGIFYGNSVKDWNLGPAGLEIRNGIAGTAQNGLNFVELDTTKNSHIFQTITTVAGQMYNLSFWYAPRAGVSENSNGIAVSWGENQSFTVSGEGSGEWTKISFSVMGSGKDKLQFNAVGKSDSYGGSLDNVSLTAAVPEPESYAMLLAGLGVMGAVARRRSKKN